MKISRGRLIRFAVGGSLLLLLGAILLISSGHLAAAASTCANPVACENQLPGDPPSDWQVNGVGDSSIQGFATSMSVNVGQTESFKIDTPSPSYHIDILRLGYYGGDGARKIASNIKPTATLPQTQPACNVDSSTGLIDCGNWGVSASWTVPSNAVSGIYIAHLVRDDSSDPGGDSQIPFVVRNDSSHSAILLATSDATWEAYNDYGGNSLYTCTVQCPPGSPLAYKGAYAVSYNRPFDGALTTDGGASYLYYAEYQMVRWLEENGYDVDYTSDSDLDQNGSLLLNHKVFMSSGHDEYWSAAERNNVTAARNAGVNLAFFSGNEIFWKTRWAASEDGSNTPYRTLITYKETHFNAPTDPQDPPTWTGSWEDPRFSPPADGGNPPNSLSGQMFLVNAGTTDIQVPSQYAKLRMWRNTAVANLTSGQTLTLSPGTGTLGYEWDMDADNGFRPPGLFDMSSTTATNAQIFTDYGSTTTGNNATATHNLTLYRASSGALVFGAGTVQWSWGLDNTNAWHESGTDPSGHAPDPNMEQATVNLFADMGAQPATLASGLVPATASTDTTPPTSTITNPAAGASLQDGAKTTITGTATDSGGGVVAGVEVSTDGGTTWHPATLTGPDGPSVGWTYSWLAHGSPSTTILSRAVDDSGNLESASDATSVNVACPCSIWGPNAPTDASDSGDVNSTEVGMQFRSDTFGTVSGMRFYKFSTNTGTHVGSLWTASGQLLAQATFSNETTSGWQQVTFSNPVPINPNTTYVIGYLAPAGHYASTETYFYPPPSPAPDWGSSVDSIPLHALRSTGTTGNGLFQYTSSPTFPTNTYNGENYWVDPIFSPSPAPGQVTGVTATPGNTTAGLSWNAPSTGGAVTTYTITPYVGGTAQQSTTVTGSPAPTSATVTGLTNGKSYTFTVTASNPNGSGAPSAASNAVTPSAGILAFVQQATGHGTGTSLAVTPSANITLGNRLVVVAGVWSASGATAASVTDSAGNSYVELLHFKASDGTETSVWSAPITAGGGTRPAITVKPTSTADVGVSASEYSGLSSVADASVVDQSADATGTTSGATTVASGATPATTAANELALGVYVDSGFGNTLTSGSGWTQRSNISNASDMDLLTEDQVLPATGATPNATVGTGPNTVWGMATLVLKPGASAPPTAPSAPSAVTATAGNGAATVSWNAPANGGSPITSYTVTPYIGSTAQTPTTVTGSPPPTSTTISGLTNGSTYTFTVTATNSVGSSAASSPSNAVTPTAPTPPDAPTNVTATAGNASATVSWTAPSNGGAAITRYTVTPYIGTTPQTATTVSGSPPATSATITGLTNGTAYTFVVTATNSAGTGPASSASNVVTPTAPTAPGPPTGVTATAGSGSATVSWTAPSNGGSAITSYTVTPYIGSTAQTPTTVTGSPPATTTTIIGLTNGLAYTFTVTATNSVGSGSASSASNAVTPTAATPAFVQQTSAHSTGVTSLAVTPSSNVTGGNRLVVLVGVWSSSNATAKSVTDAAGNTYTELQHFIASDHTEMSVWTAPITAGGGTKPKITVTPTAKADVGVAALEYAGLSTASGTGAIDQTAQNTGTTGAAGTVSSGATPATSTSNELALGFYVDSGFGDTLSTGSGFTSRTNVSATSDMEFLAEDQLPAAGATPNASAGTGASTVWLMSTIVFKHG